MSEVEAVNRAEAMALLSDGTTVSITNWMDEAGDEAGPDDAAFCVAGPLPNGGWLSIDLRGFVRRTMQ